MTSRQFKITIRVYYEDTDAAGIVYHANYLKFMERARTEWLRQVGYDQRQLAREQNVGFVVRKMTIDFIKPAKLDDQLEIVSALARCGRASMLFEQTVTHKHQILCQAQVKVGCIDLQTGSPQPMAEALYREIKDAG